MFFENTIRSFSETIVSLRYGRFSETIMSEISKQGKNSKQGGHPSINGIGNTSHQPVKKGDRV